MREEVKTDNHGVLRRDTGDREEETLHVLPFGWMIRIDAVKMEFCTDWILRVLS